MDKERGFEVPQGAIRDSGQATRQAHDGGNEKPVTDEEFVAPEGTARDLGGTAGSVSEAESLLDDKPAQAGTEASPPEEEDGSEAVESDGVFTAPTRALLDLTLSEGDEEIKDPETEAVRESIIEEINTAIESWRKYGGVDGLRLPRDIEQLSRFNRDFDGLIEKLTAVKLEMIKFGRTQEGMMPDGTNIGETLHPVLIPWEFFAHHAGSGTLPKALKLLREKQSIEEHVLDYPFMIGRENLAGDKDVTYFPQSSLTYLRKKIGDDGWWGIFLIQSQEPYKPLADGLMPETKIKKIKNYRGDWERNEPDVKFRRMNGYDIDMLGLYEWLALTLQEEPESFKGDLTLLTSNIVLRASHGEDILVAYGGWDEKTKRVVQNWVPVRNLDKEGYVNRIAINPLHKRKTEEEPEG